MTVRSQQDFATGIMFIVTGATFSIGATRYSIGDALDMGSGYFPLYLGIMLAGIGIVVMALAVTVNRHEEQSIGEIAWRPLLHVIGANVLFGILLGGLPWLGLPASGLVIALYALVIVAGRAVTQNSFRGLFVLATGLAIGTYLVFVKGLKLQLGLWPSWI